MNATTLLNAYHTYTDQMDAWESSFDLEHVLDQPPAPEMTITATAGEIIARRGSLERALAEALMAALNDSISERLHDVYLTLVMAAVEA